jgi:hypothetical protein
MSCGLLPAYDASAALKILLKLKKSSERTAPT